MTNDEKSCKILGWEGPNLYVEIEGRELVFVGAYLTSVSDVESEPVVGVPVKFESDDPWKWSPEVDEHAEAFCKINGMTKLLED